MRSTARGWRPSTMTSMPPGPLAPSCPAAPTAWSVSWPNTNEKIAKEIQMNWNPKSLCFISMLPEKQGCPLWISTESFLSLCECVSRLFCNESPLCVISTGTAGFAQMEGSGGVASSVLNNFPPTRRRSPPSSCFTIELHSGDNQGWWCWH